MKSFTKKTQQGFTHVLLLVALVALVVGVGYVAYLRTQNNDVVNTNNIANSSKKLLINDVQFSNQVDSTGKPVAPSSVLGASDSQLHVVSSLNNVVKGTRIEYTRYLDGHFVDNGSLAVLKDGAKYADFSFTANSGSSFKPGNYKVKVYANGKYQTTGNYIIQ